MKDIRKLEGIQLILLMLAVAFMILTFALQLSSFEFIRHVVLCSILILLLIGVIVIDEDIKKHLIMFFGVCYGL